MSDVPTASLIQRYCDGELSSEESARVEARLRTDPELQARVGFERRLRDRVAALMERESVPPELADRVRSAVRAETPEEIVSKPDGVASGEPDGIASGGIAGGSTKRDWWSAPQRANVFAVAACIALVLGAVLVGIFGRPIDAWDGPTDLTVAAAGAVATEHAVTASDLPTMLGSMIRAPQEAMRQLAGHLGESGLLFDLGSLGYEFIGGRTCTLPHCETGCHLLYRSTGDIPGLVSLHIVPDEGQFNLQPHGDLSRLPITTDIVPEHDNCPKDVLVWSHEGSVFLLVVCIPEHSGVVAQTMQNQLLAR